MTREEAHKQLDIQCSEGKHSIIEEIYNDFESRTCERCEHYINDGAGWLQCNIFQRISVNKSFGCNKWEAKSE